MPPLPLSAAAAQPYQPRWVVWLSVAQLISWGSVFYSFALIMEPVEQALGISRSQSSLAFSLALLAEGLMAYPVGRWIDRGLERRVMAGGSALAAMCLFLHGGVSSLASFYAVWIGLGIAMSGILYPPAFSVLTRRFPADFRRAIITMTFLGGLASTVFIPLTAALVHGLGWRLALPCLGLLHLLVCLPMHLRLLRPPKPTEAATTVAKGLALPPNTNEAHAAKPGTQAATAVAAAWTHHARSKPFVLVGGFVVLMMAVTAALPAHMVSLVRENGLPESWAIAVPACIGLAQVAGRVILYFFERYFDLHRANRLIPVLIPLGLATLLAAPLLANAQAALVVLFVVIWGLGNGMLTIVKGTVMAEYVNREHIATLNGALGLPLALARSAAPLLLGLLWSADAGYRHGLMLLLGLSIVGVLALVGAQHIALKRRQGSRNTTPA